MITYEDSDSHGAYCQGCRGVLNCGGVGGAHPHQRGWDTTRPLVGGEHTSMSPLHRVPKRIYLSPPHMSGCEQSYVAEAFATNWIAPVGPHVDAFEQEFA